MAGVEAIAAVQLIDACLGITRTILDIARAVGDAQGLPPKLRALVDQLPVVEGLLESARKNCEEGKVTQDASKNAEPILKQCEQALDGLRDIFQKACPKDGDNLGKRIWKGATMVFFGRGSQVQKLMGTIQGNLKLLEQKEIYVIGDKLDELQALTEASGHDDGSGKNVHHGEGNIFAYEGGKPTSNVNNGSGRLIVSHGTYHEAPSST